MIALISRSLPAVPLDTVGLTALFLTSLEEDPARGAFSISLLAL